MTKYPPLPPLGAATLLKALFKGPGAANAAAADSTTFQLERIDAARLARYNAALGFAADALPVTFYYLPTQRAHLATMLGAALPFRLAGMLHVENDIRELRQLERTRPLELATRVALEPPAGNGARFCELRTVGSQQGAVVFECRSRYLAVRGKRRGEGGQRAGETVASRPVGEWLLAADAGRRYATVSGDWNPIHLWPWSARLLGLRAPIIHGMHTVAKACALLERQQGRRLSAISASFKAPVPLGARAELLLAGPDGGYQVWAANQMAVQGRFR